MGGWAKRVYKHGGRIRSAQRGELGRAGALHQDPAADVDLPLCCSSSQKSLPFDYPSASVQLEVCGFSK